MDNQSRRKYEQPPVSMGMCFFIEFLICHTLLVMVVVLGLFFATQLGLFQINPINVEGGTIGNWNTGRWLSVIALEGVIVFISQRYAANQVRIYQHVLSETEARSEPSPDNDLASVNSGE